MSRKGRSGRQKGRSGVVATTPSVWYRKDVDSGFEINNPCFEKYVYAHTHTHTHTHTPCDHFQPREALLVPYNTSNKSQDGSNFPEQKWRCQKSRIVIFSKENQFLHSRFKYCCADRALVHVPTGYEPRDGLPGRAGLFRVAAQGRARRPTCT